MKDVPRGGRVLGFLHLLEAAGVCHLLVELSVSLVAKELVQAVDFLYWVLVSRLMSEG